MKPFVFRLEKVLKYRRHLLDKARLDVSAARDRAREAREALSRLSRQRHEASKNLGREGARTMTAFRYRLHQNFLDGLDRDLDEAHVRLRKGEERVTSRERALASAHIRKKIIETLKDRQWKAHRETSARAAQKEMDDMVLINRGRVT